jgi:hypothetical protein
MSKTKNMEYIRINNDIQSGDYDEYGFPCGSDNCDFSMCGYGKPTKITEYYECNICNKLYIIKSSAGRSSDGDFNSSCGKYHKCEKCLIILDRTAIKYDNEKITYDNIKLKILSYNLFNGESLEQIEFIEKNNFDILFLSEASENVIDKFNKYKGYIIKSHCGYTYLGINKKLIIDEIKLITMQGIIILHITLNTHKEVVLGSLHLAPSKQNISTRKTQLEVIFDTLQKLNLLNIPIILGGDTNMRHEEDIIDILQEFNDIYLIKKGDENFITYPNRNFKSDKLKFIPKNDFRYDRFFIKNCNCLNFATIKNNCSDHLAIETYLEI